MFLQEPELAIHIRQGLEREALRSLPSGMTSQVSHPSELGSKLTHAHITTDYAENLLEFITAVHHNTNGLLDELLSLQSFTQKNIGNELIWPTSMPCALPVDEGNIPLAYYGESNVGKLKTLYRKGLGHRYGRQMQSIAGVHYNFSLTDSFWEHKHEQEKSLLSLADYKSENYFSIIRNFHKYKWILMYLFGASPLVDKSFLTGREHKLEKFNDDTYFSPEGTSLRMGGLGYTSQAQESIGICYNQLDTYIKTLEEARLQSFPEYESLGLKSGSELLQLNTNILQIDNEFYSTIRPKNIALTRESALMALHHRGIEYIEIRLLDLDPYSITGIGKEQIYFLHLFLLHCLIEESPKISNEDCSEFDSNFKKVVTHGRAKTVQLSIKGQSISMHDWMENLFDSLSPLVDSLSTVDPYYKVAFDFQRRKITNLDLLPSQKMINDMYGKKFVDYGLNLSSNYKNQYQECLSAFEKLKDMAKESFEAQKIIEGNDKLSFEDFLVEYFENIKIKF